MGHLTRLSTRTTAAAAGALLLAGGLTGPALAAVPGPGSVAPPPSASCGTETGDQQLARWGGTLPRPFGKGTTTVASAHMVLLFHNNEYVGTTTLDPFEFEPTVVRVDTSTLDVTYHYMLPTDSYARPSGPAHSTYTWGFGTDVLSEHGDLPPGQK